MTDRELMQMALDGLERISAIDRCFSQREAIRRLSDRLAQPEPEPVAWVSGYTNGECVVRPMNPAVVFSVGTAFYYATPVHASDISQERVDETAKDRHKPVKYKEECWACGCFKCVCDKSVPKTKREWVGLTDEERERAEACCWYMDEFDQTIYAKAIEAKLRSKNNG
jgi:hypothetical protein